MSSVLLALNLSPEIVVGGFGLAVQWGYTMHRINTLERTVCKLVKKLEKTK